MSTVLETASAPGALRRPVIGICFVLAAFNIGAWIRAFIAFHTRPLLLGTGLLAYGFGLRHAVDADHIAAMNRVIYRIKGYDALPAYQPAR